MLLDINEGDNCSQFPFSWAAQNQDWSYNDTEQRNHLGKCVFCMNADTDTVVWQTPTTWIHITLKISNYYLKPFQSYAF